jgi:TolB-like protein
LRKSATERFATAGALADLLKRAPGDAAPAPPIVVRRQPRWMQATGASLIVVLLVLAALYLRPGRAAFSGVHSIAVMNLRTPSEDTRAAPFAEGLPEELSSTLSQTGLRVAAQRSIQELPGGGSVRTVGSLLGVDAVLTGTVRSYGEKFKVYVELVGTSDGFQIWSETFTADGEDLIASEQKAAVEIATHVHAVVAKK